MSQHLEGKDLVELLDMLEPVPEPAAVSLMPQTPGWIVLGIVVVVAVWWGLRRMRARRRAGAYRRAALAELDRARDRAGNRTGDDGAYIATLLRRTALAGYPRAQVAGLTGDDWLNFLDQSYDGKGFSGPEGKALLAAPYRRNIPQPGLADLARTWITTHRQLRP